MKNKPYKMSGTCATEVVFTLEEDRIHDVKFHGGCDGNLKAVMALVEGRPARDVVELLSGIRCGRKSTSCPDQLARAIIQRMAEQEEAAEQAG